MTASLRPIDLSCAFKGDEGCVGDFKHGDVMFVIRRLATPPKMRRGQEGDPEPLKHMVACEPCWRLLTGTAVERSAQERPVALRAARPEPSWLDEFT